MQCPYDGEEWPGWRRSKIFSSTDVPSSDRLQFPQLLSLEDGSLFFW